MGLVFESPVCCVFAGPAATDLVVPLTGTAEGCLCCNVLCSCGGWSPERFVLLQEKRQTASW